MFEQGPIVRAVSLLQVSFVLPADTELPFMTRILLVDMVRQVPIAAPFMASTATWPLPGVKIALLLLNVM